MIKIWQSRLTTLVLIGVLTLLGVHLVHQWLGRARLDLTATELYSLDEGSELILAKMQEEGIQPIEISLFFSETTGKTLPKFIKNFITYERYVRQLLREYERTARGKIRLRFIDPIPDSDEAQDAAAFGLDGKQINQHGDLFYFGLVFQTRTGSKDVIEFLWPNDQENIEYRISRKIHDLLWPSSRKIAVLSSLQVMGGASDPYMAQMLAAQGRTPEPKWMALELLEERYEVTALSGDVEEISHDEFDLLVVIHPKDLSGKAKWALDEWVVTGGNTLIFLDPYALADRPPRDPQQPWMALQYEPASDLDELLAAWDLELADHEFAADFELAARRSLGRGPAETIMVDLVIDAQQRDQTLDTSHPVLQGIEDLRFFLAGSLRPTDAAPAGSEGGEVAETERTWEIDPFISTTASGSTLRIEPGFGGGEELAYRDLNDAARLRDRFRPGSEPVVLAYLLNGRLPTAYPDGADYASQEPERPPGLPAGVDLPPPADAEMIHREPVPEDRRAEATVLVFADVDVIGDQIAFARSPLGFVQAANDNHKVLLNSVDYLLGSSELMSVRSQRGLDRPFTLFEEIEAAAEKDTLERERQLRADIEVWQQELADKQSEATQRNAALFEKRLQDEVDRLNEKVREANAELREIRQARRAALEHEETMVRFAVIGWMPILVLGVGVYLAARRRTLHRQATVTMPASTAASPPPPSPAPRNEDSTGAASADDER